MFLLCELHHTSSHHCATVHHSHHCAPTKVVIAPCHFPMALWLYINGGRRWVRSSEFMFVVEKNERWFRRDLDRSCVEDGGSVVISHDSGFEQW
ncbi:hypothetical protein DEO72_LG5g831 [Vigna unguiculata]|uniref:Uncharacterized protein n=1 Tax=Vigna unguiculata TaxID=3917 RepID=A0A4D6LUZ6_VIGUN|nr:hypothetical protein DEO72_LG5g831 [Vigna unguiculata]